MEGESEGLVLAVERVLPAAAPVAFAAFTGLRRGPFRTEARRALPRDGWRDSLDGLERLLGAD